MGVSKLRVDTVQIATYARTVFKHAIPDLFISLRAFFEEDAKGPLAVEAVGCGDGLQLVIDAAVRMAHQAANSPQATVFCPPPATFRDATSARECNLSQGLVLCVECDSYPSTAKDKLESLLCPATLTVASGGEWANPRNRIKRVKAPPLLASGEASNR